MSDTTGGQTGGTEGGNAGGSTGSEGTPPDGQTTGSDDGRAGGETALRADLATERRKRQEAARERDALKAEVAKLKGETGTEVERAEARARESVLGPARTMLRRSAVAIEAARLGFVDPTDAVGNLIASGTLDTIEVDDDGQTVDTSAVATLVAALATEKPHLLRQGVTPPEPRAGGDPQGGNGSGNGSGGGSSSDPNRQFRDLLVRGSKRLSR